VACPAVPSTQESAAPAPGPWKERLTLSLGSRGFPLGSGAWHAASAAGLVSAACVYTLYGLYFVHLHAGFLSREAAFIAVSGMTPLVPPFDAHLAAFPHLLGSALFFGLTLGLLCGAVCMVLTLPAWFSGRLGPGDLPLFLAASGICTYLGFSLENAAVSVAAGILCPAAFTAAWAFVLAKRCHGPSRTRMWPLFLAVLCAPQLVVLASGASMTHIRDALVSSPVLSRVSDFYYRHTLLAADVIKPVAARAQNIIAVSADLGPIGPMPHGTLWVRTADPCGVRAARLVVAPGPLPCPSVVAKGDGRPLNAGDRVLRVLARDADPNRIMRGSIGFFLFSGPLVALFAFVLSLAALCLSRLAARAPATAAALLALYLFACMPAARCAALKVVLENRPEKVSEYATSGSETRRYLAVTTFPGAVAEETLRRMLTDPSPRVRINALVEAGRRRARGLLDEVVALTRDPELNVRTKACWALGRIGAGKALDELERIAREDPEWYVRDYAYAAIGLLKPEAREILLTGGMEIGRR